MSRRSSSVVIHEEASPPMCLASCCDTSPLSLSFFICVVVEYTVKRQTVMHISIPYTEEKFDEGSQAKHQYTLYHVYINGAFHCAQRYSQLHILHDKVRRHKMLMTWRDGSLT